jgi:hypothetical protein
MAQLNNINFSNKLNNLYGVEGLLLLLCISLTIISPFTNFLFLFVKFGRSGKLIQLFEGNISILIFTSISIVLILFSMISGILLWRKKDIGLILVKIYLLLLYS